MTFPTATSSNIFENSSNVVVRGVSNISFKRHNPLTIFIKKLKKMVVDFPQRITTTANASQLELRGVQYS